MIKQEHIEFVYKWLNAELSGEVFSDRICLSDPEYCELRDYFRETLTLENVAISFDLYCFFDCRKCLVSKPSFKLYYIDTTKEDKKGNISV